MDLPRATKISNSEFAIYTGWNARLQRALISYIIDHQTLKRDYREILPPYIITRQSLVDTEQLPKFEDDLYAVDEDEFLIPTAEIPITNLFRDEILENDQLTMKFAASSAYFRRETGTADKDTRGIQRMHQFDKMELVKYYRPEENYDELESLTANTKSVLQSLGLHYRIALLCTDDMSFSNAKYYDLEV